MAITHLIAIEPGITLQGKGDPIEQSQAQSTMDLKVALYM